MPANRYYGIQTLRAVENFSITGIPISLYPNFIFALAQIKKAAALTNVELGLLPEKLGISDCQSVRPALARQAPG